MYYIISVFLLTILQSGGTDKVQDMIKRPDVKTRYIFFIVFNNPD